MSDTEEDSLSGDNWLVNVEWIHDFLRDYHKTKEKFVVNDYSVSGSSSNGVSNLSEVLSVKIDYEHKDEKNHLDLFIKLLPQDPFSRFFVTEAQFDLREIKFYTQIVPDLLSFQKKNIKDGEDELKIPVPKCYHSNYTRDPVTGERIQDPSPDPSEESILVLQDMRTLGYKSAHFITGLSLDEAKDAIKSICNVHSLSLAMKFKEKCNLNEKYPFLFQVTKASDSYQQLVESGLPQLGKFLSDRGSSDAIASSLNEIKNKTRDIIEKLLQPIEPMGLITHTDFWSNNLLFRENPTDDFENMPSCVIIDWQMITYSRPTNDIALLLISSLPSNVRRDNMSSLLDFYYQCLKSNLKKFNIHLERDFQYTREKLSEDYKKSQLLALLLCIGSVDIALGNIEAEQRFMDVLEDFYKDGIFDKNFLNAH